LTYRNLYILPKSTFIGKKTSPLKMESNKVKKEYHDFHIEIEKSIAQRLFQYCEHTDDKIISVFRRSLRLYLDAEDQKNQQTQL